MRALDLFCGAGGVTRGLLNAGFDEVVGVDIEGIERYHQSGGSQFWNGDVFDLSPSELRDFDFVWASPPCQAHVSLRHMHNAKKHEDLIGRTRGLLIAAARPYVIENVVDAPLINPVRLCGSMFDLRTCDDCAELRRHRKFEASFPIEQPACRHSKRPVIGVYGGHYRDRRRKGGENRGQKDFTFADAQTAMGIDWMTSEELSQSIPPAYAEYIARQFLDGRSAMKEAA